MRAARAILAAFSCDESRNLSIIQLRVMAALIVYSDETQAEIAARLQIATSSMTRTMAVLIERGLLTRVENAVDRRRFMLTLTPAGRNLLMDIDARHRSRVAA
jgi:DNA-binding MarR family transcriptional regulator